LGAYRLLFDCIPISLQGRGARSCFKPLNICVILPEDLLIWFFCDPCDLLRLFQSSFYLCAFASLADVAKGGDGAKSALPEILLRLFFAFFVPFRGYLFSP